jgi:hypothetical protein
VLERGERIELLVQSTDNLQTQAFSFKRDAGRLQRSMWWKNVRAQVLAVADIRAWPLLKHGRCMTFSASYGMLPSDAMSAEHGC